MRRPTVVVLFQHHLFGAAIARALGENDQFKVVTRALHTLSAQALKTMHADAIVVEGPMTGNVGTSLLGAPPVLTVVVGPETNTAEVYERREVIHATAAEISARIIAASGPKRVTTARRRSCHGGGRRAVRHLTKAACSRTCGDASITRARSTQPRSSHTKRRPQPSTARLEAHRTEVADRELEQVPVLEYPPPGSGMLPKVYLPRGMRCRVQATIAQPSPSYIPAMCPSAPRFDACWH